MENIIESTPCRFSTDGVDSVEELGQSVRSTDEEKCSSVEVLGQSHEKASQWASIITGYSHSQKKEKSQDTYKSWIVMPCMCKVLLGDDLLRHLGVFIYTPLS